MLEQLGQVFPDILYVSSGRPGFLVKVFIISVELWLCFDVLIFFIFLKLKEKWNYYGYELNI